MNWYKRAMPMMTELPSGYMITYRKSGTRQMTFNIVSKYVNADVYGFIDISKIDGKTWFVSGVEASKGYGPLLYEIAMEYVTSLGEYLVSNELAEEMVSGEEHPGITSRDAKKVWNKFRERASFYEEGGDPRKIPEAEQSQIWQSDFGFAKPRAEHLPKAHRI